MTEITDMYCLVRMWCPPDEADDWEQPRFVQLLSAFDGQVSWTLTKDWQEANYFNSEVSAKRVVRGVERIRSRIENGWIYEILKVTEEIVDHNKTEEQEGEAA